MEKAQLRKPFFVCNPKAYLYLAALCSGLFAESIKKEIDIKDVAAFLHSDEFYNTDSVTLQIKDNFKPEDVTVSEIKALSKFVAHDSDNKIENSSPPYLAGISIERQQLFITSDMVLIAISP